MDPYSSIVYAIEEKYPTGENQYSTEQNHQFMVDYEKFSSRSSSSSFSDSLTDDSVEADYTPLETDHLQKALEKGVFSDVNSRKRHERKKSFDKPVKFKRQLSEIEQQHRDEFPHNLQRARSVSCDTKPTSDLHRRRKGSPKRSSEKIRKQLSKSGISLHSHKKMSLEEIHDMQQRFYTAMKMPPNEQHDGDALSFVPRGRSSSSIV